MLGGWRKRVNLPLFILRTPRFPECNKSTHTAQSSRSAPFTNGFAQRTGRQSTPNRRCEQAARDRVDRIQKKDWSATDCFSRSYNFSRTRGDTISTIGPLFAFSFIVRLWERADLKPTGSRWPWERWYSVSVGFFSHRFNRTFHSPRTLRFRSTNAPLPFPPLSLYNTLVVPCLLHRLPRNRTVSTERMAFHHAL